MNRKIVIIGYGNIGKIYAESFEKTHLIDRENIFVISKNPSNIPFKIIEAGDQDFRSASIIFICVKPQDFAKLSETLRGKINGNQMVVSVMGGITTEKIAEKLEHQKIFRAMPNASMALGMGMTGYYAGQGISKEELLQVENLLGATGKTLFIADEDKMDAVTALSGSGPAYFYFIVQTMIDSGIQMGFSTSESENMVRQTMLGAYHLMIASGKSTDDLIREVASKGGTTEAAFEVFRKMHLKEAIEGGILRARDRGRELALF